MANSVSARKSARQSLSRRLSNQGLRTAYRTSVKSVQKAIDSGDKKVAQDAFKSAQSSIDKIADKKIVHKNKAARHKKRLNASIQAMS
ncbi:MAG: 30S ribosomal protein S20 [Betaproteobacteria bacterium TMED100]|nr:MAG: 30S ribosomal protein S20 [Betaproteobacteria bacterium TMED100]|tara:strand:+ start:275 stop:538 length:264 start_codon:yes stop_codon:yes gene_type:complete